MSAADLGVVVIGYALGAVPFGWLIARMLSVDPRQTGSGSTGATNVLRAAGPFAAMATLLLDGAKGAAAVWLAERSVDAPLAGMAAGIAAVVGHIHPIWLHGRGGKGVATTAGTFLVLDPLSLALATVAFVGTLGATRIVSAASMAGAAALPVAAVFRSGQPGLGVGAVVCMGLVLVAHRANAARILRGTEPRLGS